MPMLVPSLNSCPMIGGGRASACWIRLATRTASLAVPGIGQHDQKLVAAQPADGVFLPYRRAQQTSDLSQAGIARRMSQGVVDSLETVEVDEEHDDLVAGAIRHRQRLVEAIQQQPCGWADRSAYRSTLVGEFAPRLVLRGDVGISAQHADNVPVGIDQRALLV